MGALVFYNPEHRILISGDALWENGFGFVMPPEIDPAALPATRATLDMLATLDVRVVIPGHGEPFTDVAGALDRARRRVASFDADSLRVARHALKVNLMFALLDKQRMPLAELAGLSSSASGIYRDFNALFFRLPPARLAELLVGELVKAGAARSRPATSCPGRRRRLTGLADRGCGAPGASTRGTPRRGPRAGTSSAGLRDLQPDVMPQSDRLIVAVASAPHIGFLLNGLSPQLKYDDLEASPAWSRRAS